MPSTARQTVDITSLIKGILNGYPGNSAIFREYLQNSDDAKATKQIFVLDVRHHPTDSLVDPILTDTQGPALIAWNDQILSDRDWAALKKIHASSKGSDETQTGKNGLGFRASFHLTENPQILSGRSLVVLDPHDEFHQHPGGAEIDIVTEGPQYTDQLRSFESILKDPFKEFRGTVFRLPFRTQRQANRSRIKNTPTSVDEMKELLSNFAQELEEVILFLKHITSIEIRLVSDAGEQVHGIVTIDPRPVAPLKTFTRRITVEISGQEKRTRSWKYYHYKVDRNQAKAILSKRLHYDVKDFLVVDKLTPDVELALPLDRSSISGRLFTLLPLPIRTGFPVHFNAVFALTPDRQSLKNIHESGTKQSRERRLIEWNRIIFDDFGAKAWARLLSDLSGDIDDIWSVWPPKTTNKNFYWISLVSSIIQEAKMLKIFPIISSLARPPLVSLIDRSVLLAPQDPPISLAALAKMGVSIVQPPPYIFDILVSPLFKNFFTKLSPHSSYERLRSVCVKYREIPADSATDIEEITNYLVFCGNAATNPAFERLIGLPWFTSMDGSPICLCPQYGSTEAFVVPGTEDETLVFDTSRVMLAWPCISNGLRNALSTPAASVILNVTTLTTAHVLPLLKDRFSHRGSQDEVPGSDTDIHWLLHFWKWVSGWKNDEFNRLAPEFGGLYILPTASGTLKNWANLSILLVENATTDLLEAWKEIDISILHADLANSDIFQILQDHKIGMFPFESSYLSFLARDYRCTEPSSISSKSRTMLRSSIQRTLAWALSWEMIVSLSAIEKQRLSSLPLFSTFTGTGGSPNLLPICGHRRYIQLKDDIPLPVLPSTEPLVYVDMNDSLTERLVQLVDSSASSQILDGIGLLKLAVDHWSLQPQSLLETFIERILDNLLKFPPDFCDKLRTLTFISVEGQTQLAAPRDVIDPASKLAELYKGETGKVPCGRFSGGRYLTMMQGQQLFSSNLNPEMVAERLDYIASTQNDEKATAFFCLLNDSWKESFAEIIIAHQDARWMPLSNSPSRCRDDREPPHHHYLYDHVFTIIHPRNWTVSSPGLRKALGWSDVVPFDVLLKQFSFTIGNVDLADRTERLKYLIGYLANYPTLSPPKLETLREIVKGVSWVPVHGLNLSVSLIQHATLCETSLGPPFHQVQQASEPQHHNFLSRMGCADRPSIDTLIVELKKALSPESWSLSVAIPILQEIADYHKETIPRRSDILIPINSVSNEARSLTEIYYQDMMSDHILGIEKYAAHSEISKGLAVKLGIPLASSVQLEDKKEKGHDELQMSEDLVGRIQGFLRENDIRFALNELLANADDAKATRFSMKFLPRASRQAAATMEVVSPAFQNLENVSHLIIWNDSLFTQEDFNGMRRVGCGGKRGREDTHGRHGLGALGLFYFTDVPMIISGDHILILDPSSGYLPPRGEQKRTSLFRNLSWFMRKFPDQLRSLHGNFGFTPQQETYNGTLFLLPLPSTIYEQEFPDYENLLRTTYRDLAANAFFFTRLTDIRVEYGTQTWHMSVDSRTDPSPLNNHFTHHLLEFNRGDSAENERWMIATSDKSLIPPTLSAMAHQLKFPPNSSMPVQLAIRIDRRRDPVFELPEPSYLFSTLCLPKITSLPFHLHARFAISANRQNLVLDPPNRENASNPKSTFNAWILCELVCPLYLAAFAHIIRAYPLLVASDPRDWLIFKSNGDDVSCYVGDSMMEHLPGTDLQLFASANQKWLTFQQSVFSSDEPEEIRDVLTWLKAPVFVSSFRDTPVPLLPGAKQVTPAYLIDQLRHPESFSQVEEFLNRSASEGSPSFKRLTTVAQYVQTEENIIGLPIIVASTGKLCKIPSKDDPPIYFSPNASHANLFPTSVFMHDSYSLETVDAMAKNNLSNIHLLTEERVSDIIAIELGRFAKTNQSPSPWLRQLWEQYNGLPGPPTVAHLHCADLKIIESTQGFISIANCTSKNVVQSPGFHNQWIVSIMSKLAINVVIRQELNIIQKYIEETFPELFINVLECLGNQGLATIDSFGGLLDEESHWLFAAWMCSCYPKAKGKGKRQRNLPSIDSRIDNLKGVLHRLPIWEAHYKGRTQLVPAHRVKVLPDAFSLQSIAPYLTSDNVAMAIHSTPMLDSLSYSTGHRVQPLTSEALFDILELPSGQLEGTTQIDDYKNFLLDLLSQECTSLRGKLRVPDDNLVLRLPEELFSHQVALFSRSLKHTPQSSFIHESFRGLTGKLYELGLRHEINFQNLQTCAIAVEVQGRLYLNADMTRRQEIMQMADAVFQSYCETAPGIIGTNDSQWSQLDNIAFVRRKGIRREDVDYDPENYCNDLPPLLPPSMLLKPSLEPIAWTMLGLPSAEPSDHLLAVNKSLGEPSADQVVEHLRILSTEIAQHHSGNIYLLSDLRATYEWLDSNHQHAGRLLARRSKVPLFLNVDNPENDPWATNWIAADQLVLNLLFDTRERKGVRKFLQPYQNLLLVAGCHNLTLEEYPMDVVASVTDDLSRLRGTLNEMRSLDRFTDMCFVPTSSSIYRKCDDTIVYNDKGGLPGHKVFLVAAIPHFMILLDSQSINHARIELDGSPFVAKAILDFAYTGSLNYPAPESKEDEMSLLRELCELLHKSEEWDMSNLKCMVQKLIIEDHNMIQRLPQRFKLMYKAATDAEAEILKNALDRFQAVNVDILEQLNDGEGIEEITQEHQSIWDDSVADVFIAEEGESDSVVEGIEEREQEHPSIWDDGAGEVSIAEEGGSDSIVEGIEGSQQEHQFMGDHDAAEASIAEEGGNDIVLEGIEGSEQEHRFMGDDGAAEASIAEEGGSDSVLEGIEESEQEHQSIGDDGAAEAFIAEEGGSDSVVLNWFRKYNWFTDYLNL